MKSLSTFIVFFFLSLTLCAQYGLDPEVILLETDGEDFEVKVDVTNNTGEFAYIYWMYEKGVNYPEEWSTVICDDTICYQPNKFKSSSMLPNAVNADDTFLFKFTIQTQGVAGSTYGIIHLYDDDDCSNEVATSLAPTVSVEDAELLDLKVYPNPTSDFFGVKNDVDIKYLDVIDHTGRILIKKAHQQDELHSIAHLPTGNYIVVLKDGNNEIVESKYLSKR